ncbi:MAG: hypothetical protein KF817_13565 [Phycisphaeraceae bacterium]|nr:hypothetical protein [Phycisphaeraceae bacterium]
MRRFLDTVGGVCALLRLGVQTRFRFRGPYWSWRTETAFGHDRSAWPPRRARLHAALEYGRWMHRMRRFR